MGPSNGQNKDAVSRSKGKGCKEEVGNLLSMILGEIEFDNKKWEGRMRFEKKTELVKKAKARLQYLQGLLKQFESLMQPFITEIKSSGRDMGPVESTLKKLVSFWKKEQKSTSDDLQSTGKTLQETKQELQSYGEDLKKLCAMGEQTEQSLEVQKRYANFANRSNKVADSCVEDFAKQDCTNQIQGHCGVERKGEELTISNPKAPGSIQINEKGKNAELHNQEGYLEVDSIDEWLKKHLLTGNCGNSSDMEIPSDLEEFGDWLGINLDDEGTSIVQGYKVSKCYVDVLNEIFQERPDIAENFRVAHPDFRNHFMNSLAEIYLKIKKIVKDIEKMTESEDIKDIEEMTESVDIKDMEIKVEDLESFGLQVTWLKEMLANIQEWLESREKERKSREEERKSREEAESANAKSRKASQKLGVGKKRRFHFSSEDDDSVAERFDATQI